MNYLWHKDTEGPITIVMVSSGSVRSIFKQETLKQPKLLQLDMVLYMWFTAMHSEGDIQVE